MHAITWNMFIERTSQLSEVEAPLFPDLKHIYKNVCLINNEGHIFFVTEDAVITHTVDHYHRMGRNNKVSTESIQANIINVLYIIPDGVGDHLWRDLRWQFTILFFKLNQRF